MNVLLLIQDDGWKPLPTPNIRADSDYCHKNGLITKRDIRIISLERLRLQEADVVWDIGAGSGAMSVEIAETVWRGKVFAVEKDEDCLACIRENSTRYGAMNLQILAGQAPEILMGLPAPSAVFIGGSGGNLLDILNHVKSAADLGCRIVANFTVMENLMSAHQWMKKMSMIQRLLKLFFTQRSDRQRDAFYAINPIFILSGKIKKRQAMNGKLIGVGVGPGDPELITLKALRLIQTAAVIAYTVDKNGNCYAKNSTKDYFPYGIRELPLTFSMACDRTERIQYRQNAANQLRDILHTGQDVVFITEGDPLLYSTFQHLCTALSSEIQIEVCPGISAMNARQLQRHAFPGD